MTAAGPLWTFRALGWSRWRSREQVTRYWRSNGGADTKHVEIWLDAKDRRIDLIVLR